MSKVVLAVFTYVVLTFAIAMVWNMVLFRDVYMSLASASLRDGPIIPLGLMSVVSEATAISLLFHLYYRKQSGMGAAVGLALAVGVFSITYASFTVPAKFEIEPIWQYVSLELLFGGIHYTMIGCVFYFIFRAKNSVQDPGNQ